MLWEGGGREQRNGEEKSRKGPRFRWERGGKGIGEGAEREERERRKDQSRRVSYVLRGRVLCTTGLAKGGNSRFAELSYHVFVKRSQLEPDLRCLFHRPSSFARSLPFPSAPPFTLYFIHFSLLPSSHIRNISSFSALFLKCLYLFVIEKN